MNQRCGTEPEEMVKTRRTREHHRVAGLDRTEPVNPLLHTWDISKLELQLGFYSMSFNAIFVKAELQVIINTG